MSEDEENVYTSFLGTGWDFPPTFSRISKSVGLLSEEDELWLKTADELVLDGPVLNLWLEDKDISIKSKCKPILDEITYLLSENDVLIHEEIELVVEVEIDRIINTGICENPDIMPFDFNKKNEIIKG